MTLRQGTGNEWIEANRLWLVLDRQAAAPKSLLDVAQECIAGGIDVVAFRARDLTAGEALPLAQDVRELCAETGTPFVLSHFVELVDELEPNALHLGAADEPLAVVRAELPAEIALGYSAHSVAEARAAAEAGADYVWLGPVFDTPSKRAYGPPLGVDVVPAALDLPVPVVFIGGINPHTLPQLVRAGARRIAAIGALQAVDDSRAAAEQLSSMIPD